MNQQLRIQIFHRVTSGLFFLYGVLLLGTSNSYADFVLPSSPPVPKDNPQTPAKVHLGKMLYFDPRLSVDGTVSCNSCHNVMGAGDDGRSVSVGVKGQKGDRSSPTVFNAAFMSVQFWDGRAASLEEQAKGPLTNPIEMGMKDHDAVMERVKQIPGYASSFKKAFPGEEDPLTIDHLAKAIAAYERTLITPNAPFDRFMGGSQSAISASAKRGWKKVQEVGCLACHNGVNFAGPTLPEGQGFFMKFPTFPNNEYVKKYGFEKDGGRYRVTKKEEDRHFYRVSSWRNVARTAPYFHNGKVETLDEAVRVMAKTQLNLDLEQDAVEDIVSFLESLNGEIPKQTMPKLPLVNKKSVVDIR